MQRERACGAAAGEAAAPPPRGRALGEVGVAVAVVGLAVAAVMTLPLSASAMLGLLCLFAAGAMVHDGRPMASHGLCVPSRLPGVQAITLLAFPAGLALAYATSQVHVYAVAGRWLRPLADLHIPLFAFYLGGHVVWAALPEELLFRGYLETRVRSALEGRRRRAALTILVVAAANAAAHAPLMDLGSLAGVALLGVALSWLRERTGSLAGPFFCHAAYNATLAWMEVSHA